MSKYNFCVDGVSVEAVFNKLGGVDGARRFLRGELVLKEKRFRKYWREHDGIIYFSVKSDGTTGKQWINRLKDSGYNVNKFAEEILLSPFETTSGVKTKVAIIKGIYLKSNDYTANDVALRANDLKLNFLNIEVACLIREKFTDEEINMMGLKWIIAMHKPIKNSLNDHILLCLGGGNDNGHWFNHVYLFGPGQRWNREMSYGFALTVSQTQQ